MSNEQLFFGLSQVLRKFPKETGKFYITVAHIFLLCCKHCDINFLKWYVSPDRVLCHFCFKQKNVINKVLNIDSAKGSQMMISSIILLKTALDALPLLTTVKHTSSNLCIFIPFILSELLICINSSR